MITISYYYSSTLMYSAICCGISGIVIFIMHFKIKFRKEIVAKYIIGLSPDVAAAWPRKPFPAEPTIGEYISTG